jgi:hypothetical protein
MVIIGGEIMSAYLYLGLKSDDDPEAEPWESSAGLLSWVVSFLADHVHDKELAAQLKQDESKAVRYLPLSMFTDDQVRDIVRVIRDLLPAAAEAAFPPPDEYGGAEALRELVDMVTEWGRTQGF